MSNFLKAVIFDMDGVITDTMAYHYRAWKEIFRDEGVPVTRYEVYQREGQRGIVSIQEIFRKYGRPFSLELGKKILAKKEHVFKRIVRQRFISGSRSFIKSLARRGFRLALVTGTSRHEIEKVLPDGLLNCFSVIISGSDVKQGKPHPEPYLKAMKRLDIANSRAVVIENAPFGIRSAKAAGLKCFAIETSLPKQYLHEADAVFHNFSELKCYFKDHYGL